MSKWFTVEKINSRSFAVSEYQHREETHCYLICRQLEQGRGFFDFGCIIIHIRKKCAGQSAQIEI